jgi:hypothetical protein
MQSEKVIDGVIPGVKFTTVCFNGKYTAQFKAQPNLSQNFSTVQEKSSAN